jgi:hypothetical protein
VEASLAGATFPSGPASSPGAAGGEPLLHAVHVVAHVSARASAVAPVARILSRKSLERTNIADDGREIAAAPPTLL